MGSSLDGTKVCSCGKNPAKERHSCPYQFEMSSEAEPDEDYCNCCDECRYQCAMDI